MTKLENALIWIYVKTWGKFGNHIIEEKDLWNFADGDLETAIMGLAYPRKKEKPERIQALTDLIMEKFEQGGLVAFREWSGQIHDEFIETLPQTLDSDRVGVNQHVMATQFSVITDEIKKLERETKENFARLSSLAIDLLNQERLIKIEQWDPGKYFNFKLIGFIKTKTMLNSYLSINISCLCDK